MFIFPRCRQLIFAKSPELGKVKTRMQASYSRDFSLQLHIQLTDYFLSTCHEEKVLPMELWLAGEPNMFEQYLPQWQRPEMAEHLSIYPQQGEDLGERMAFAALSRLQDKKDSIEKVILTGTDCPFIDGDYLMEACRALSKHDVVIGPASDGGYVLLGISAYYADLFKTIDWGSERVLSQTMAQIQSMGLSYYTLPVLNDIDLPSDLIMLEKLNHFNLPPLSPH